MGSSSLTVAQLQNLYYYVLRNAKSTLVLHPDMIYKYLKGSLPLKPIGKFHQFTSFFPTNLHPQKSYSPSHEVVKGIVVIDDPAVEFISKEDFQRFRCLSSLNDLKIDRVVSLSHRPVQLDESRGTEQDCSRNGEVTPNGLVTKQDFNSYGEIRETFKGKKEDEPACVSLGKKQECSRNKEATSNGIVSDQKCNSPRETCKRKKDEEEAVAVHAACEISKTPERFREVYRRKRLKNSSTKATNKIGALMERNKTDKPTKCDEEPAVVITGTASKGASGPSIGAVDIGVNEVAYFFQVALPGVSQDNGEFSCEIESDGKVILEGSTTTGVKTVNRFSRVFEMKVKKLCPPGPFKLCFSLPGPVDPRLVSPIFRSDGIFEAVIIRKKNS
ncbi:increased DNA methylation 3 isoform X2 [Eutrema salsugineum]|nr:increased DNA methylation 3 isoform X2 [Eutrema salsugineum]XP_024008430.1 increased DNA methylation 3 isoform X2 [Eutrema salsugineum]